jgi:hypothetical protein
VETNLKLAVGRRVHGSVHSGVRFVPYAEKSGDSLT